MKQAMTYILSFTKWILKCLLLGIVILFVFNFVGSYLNMNIPVNIFTILLIGILRIPGLVAILIYNII